MISLRFFFLFLVIFGAIDSAIAKRSSRGKIYELHQRLKANNKDIFKKNRFENRSLGQSSNRAIRKFQRLNLKNSLEAIASKKPDFMTFTVPTEDGNLLDLEVMQVKAPATNVILSDGGKLSSTNQMSYYRGSIRDQEDSLVTLTIQGNTITGAVSTDVGENLEIQTQGTEHILYNIKDTTEKPEPFKCETADSDETQNSVQDLLNTTGTESEAPQALVAYTTTPVKKKVRWYYETDYDLFVNKGSAANVTSYIQSAFNQVATLYANDGIVVELKTLYVWTTTDPYTSSDKLGQFGSYRTSWDGDLAFLVGMGNSGVAYVNGVSRCNYSSAQSIYQKAYAGISSTYKNAPDYSWTVEVLTHEMGHQLGSSHTHACAWNGNNTKIDSCGDSAGYSEGSCGTNPGLPSAGGTIMSYCHLTSVGVNFNNGFGVQPQTLIAGKINNSVCLLPVDTVTPTPAPDTTAPTVALTNPTSTSVVSGSAVVLSASATDNLSVSKVEFYVDNILVGTDTTAPYSLSWNSTAAINGLHSFFTKAFDNAGNMGTSPAISAQVTNTTAIAPKAPTYLAGSVSGGRVTLSWTDNSTNETGFDIEMAPRPVSGSPVYKVIGSVSANVRSYVDTRLVNGTYYYRVRAKNATGYSAYSTAISKTLTVLPAPSYLSGTVSGRKVTLKWYDRSTNETGFVVEMALYGSSTYSVITTVPMNSTSYIDTRSNAGTYKYRVKAINTYGSSSYSSVIQKTVY